MRQPVVEQTLIFSSSIPTLNHYIRVERGNRMAAAKLKKDTERSLSIELLAQKAQPMMAGPLALIFTWMRTSRREDPDNISFGAKPVLDCLVRNQIIRGDGWKDITSISHTFVHTPAARSKHILELYLTYA
jgi:hypothetical protein